MKKGVGKNGLIAALDVGSSKVCCFIAEENPGGQPRVLGIGQQASRGLKNGAIVDLDKAEGAILNAVHAAEEMAGVTIDRVLVNLSCGYPASSSIGIEVAISGHEVGEADLQRAFEQTRNANCLKGETEAGRQPIHFIPTSYSIDGNRGIRDPLGMFGEQLGVSLHIITAASSAVRNLGSAIQRCHLLPAGYVVSPFASGLATLVEDEKDLGVTLVDLGGGTTTIAVFFEGKVVYTDIVPVGGNHVTSDIARGLSTTLTHAERIKTLFGHAIPSPSDEREMIDVPQVGESDEDNVHQVPRSLMIGIMRPRLEETLELIRSRLEESGFDKVAGRRVVLTGGASQLPGLRELAGLVLDKQVRIGKPHAVAGLAEATSGPAYSCCVGLLSYALDEETTPGLLSVGESAKTSGFVGRLGSWFREHF